MKYAFIIWPLFVVQLFICLVIYRDRSSNCVFFPFVSETWACPIPCFIDTVTSLAGLRLNELKTPLSNCAILASIIDDIPTASVFILCLHVTVHLPMKPPSRGLPFLRRKLHRVRPYYDDKVDLTSLACTLLTSKRQAEHLKPQIYITSRSVASKKTSIRFSKKKKAPVLRRHT